MLTLQIITISFCGAIMVYLSIIVKRPLQKAPSFEKRLQIVPVRAVFFLELLYDLTEERYCTANDRVFADPALFFQMQLIVIYLRLI